ncbi:DUF974-domain-containing protein [Schizopora paradoxa]|uniref:DUF974-domain-containing protein n=1 Tax=Schizopora paradoxa TaxID=27342 RepID=A0A0H2S529_9AGAM|nr:DUF974-domain-containing protein [Schizopora paradoxa]
MATNSNADGVQHPLSLKVMRVSRPSLAAHWEPFFSSSPSYSAHSTAHALSLQGATPLNGHPKTLRDLSNAGEMFTLPTAFGAIQLGETFSCCLAVNNETAMDVEAVSMKVEMQTATNKIILAEVGGGEHKLSARDTIETVVRHEIRELGQHVLACTVIYGDANMRQRNAELGTEPNFLSFRKFYKFTVTNPLSVKTKVNVPRSPTASMSSSERDKLFLEVHIQNLTQSPLWFEKIQLEPVEGWNVEDGNLLPSATTEAPQGSPSLSSIFTGSTSVMQPQDIRQYIYIMTPKTSSSSSRIQFVPAPGTIVPLGRLDISWRSSMGEPGRLLTSVLSRRIPLPSASPLPSNVPAPSALPPHLQKSTLPPSRSRSPSVASQQQFPHRVSTPPLPPIPQRPASPFKRATVPSPLPSRPLSPGHGPEHALVSGAHRFGVSPSPGVSAEPAHADIEVDILVTDRPADSTAHAEEQFSLRLSLAVSATLEAESESQPRRNRILKLALQHTVPVDSEKMKLLVDSRPTDHPAPGSLSSHLASALSSPRSASIDAITPRQILSPGPGTPGGRASRGLSSPELIASPTTYQTANFAVEPLADRLRTMTVQETRHETRHNMDGPPAINIPPPYTLSSPEDQKAKASHSGEIRFVGPSLILLPPMTFKRASNSNTQERAEEVVDLTVSYVPLSKGFARIGGLRIWLLDDTLSDDSDAIDDNATLYPNFDAPNVDSRLLKEWSSVGELWIV